MSNLNPLDHGVVLVTGAGSGMGQASSRKMAAPGRRLLLCDFNGERLETVAAELRTRSEVDTLIGDISDEAFPDRLRAALGDRPIGGVVHCAGLSPTMAEPARILEVNLAATMRLVEAVRPRMAVGATVVLFASVAAHGIGAALDEQLSTIIRPEAVASLLAYAPESGAAYSVSKRAVLLLVRRESFEFGRVGARIVSLSPGIIDTPMGRAEMEQQPIMKAMVEKSALRRAAQAEEVAAVAAFLCSPAASFITGTDILVDGGASAGAA